MPQNIEESASTKIIDAEMKELGSGVFSNNRGRSKMQSTNITQKVSTDFIIFESNEVLFLLSMAFSFRLFCFTINSMP